LKFIAKYKRNFRCALLQFLISISFWKFFSNLLLYLCRRSEESTAPEELKSGFQKIPEVKRAKHSSHRACFNVSNDEINAFFNLFGSASW